jgi:hypothetical protein
MPTSLLFNWEDEHSSNIRRSARISRVIGAAGAAGVCGCRRVEVGTSPSEKSQWLQQLLAVLRNDPQAARL